MISSAACGVIEGTYYKPGILWVFDKIRVSNPFILFKSAGK